MMSGPGYPGMRCRYEAFALAVVAVQTVLELERL